MTSEEIKKEMDRLGLILNKQKDEYLKALYERKDMDGATALLLPTKDTLEKIVALADQYKIQTDIEEDEK